MGTSPGVVPAAEATPVAQSSSSEIAKHRRTRVRCLGVFMVVGFMNSIRSGNNGALKRFGTGRPVRTARIRLDANQSAHVVHSPRLLRWSLDRSMTKDDHHSSRS